MTPSPPPSSIRKRDGQVFPFEPERLSRSLFAATESLGSPNAFLARELTDSVIHFLIREADTQGLTTDSLVEFVVKVVRELGHPGLAKAYQESERRPHSKAPAAGVTEPANQIAADPFTMLFDSARTGLSQLSLSQVYPRDLVSAHREGLIRLMDLDIPNEMVGMVLSQNQPLPLDGWELLELLISVRGLAGSFVALDGPEHSIAAREGIPEEMAARFHTILDRSLWLSNLHGILNLNALEGPGWATPLNMGLFQEFQKEMESERLDRIAVYLLRHARNQSIFWHLSDRDFREDRLPRLREIIARSTAREGVEFVFDRHKRPIALGPGVDRRCPVALGMTGVDLARFVDQLGGGPLDPDLYLKKLGSLARFAKSAGHARQDYLRKQGRPQLHEGFLLERAVQIVLPWGVSESARKVLGSNGTVETIAVLARSSLQTIHETMELDQPRAMATRIDSHVKAFPSIEPETESRLLPRQQLRFGDSINGTVGLGCLTVFLKRSDPAGVNELPELLRSALRGDVSRLRFAWRG